MGFFGVIVENVEFATPDMFRFVHEILDWNVQQLKTMPMRHHSIVFFCGGKISSAAQYKVLGFYILIILAFHLRQKR
jgi:hypothetical protein